MSDQEQALLRRIETLEDRLKILEATVEPTREELITTRQNLLELRAPFKIGQVITWGRYLRKGRIFAVGAFAGGTPIYKAIVIRKDGTEGKRVNVWQEEVKLA